MQYKLLILKFASLHLEQHYSNAIPVICLTVGMTVATTALPLMQYKLFALELASV